VLLGMHTGLFISTPWAGARFNRRAAPSFWERSQVGSAAGETHMGIEMSHARWETASPGAGSILE